MSRRIDLHNELERLLGSDQVFFQKPEDVKMHYPAILYDYDRDYIKNADNVKYLKIPCYTVTVIDYDPDSEVAERISDMPSCKLDRTYQANNLNHFVYTLYY